MKNVINFMIALFIKSPKEDVTNGELKKIEEMYKYNPQKLKEVKKEYERKNKNDKNN